MSMRLIRFFPVGLILALAACESHDAEPGHQPGGGAIVRGKGAMVSTTLTVEAVDAPHRTVTLKGPQGHSATYTVGEEVKRFSEVKVGDSLVVQYTVGVIAELREATVEEKGAPIVLKEGIGRAPSDVPPAGAITRTVKVVTTIDALDKQAQTMTLKGPLEGTVTAKVDDGEVFKVLKVGQTVVATFGEQLVLAIEPGTKK